MMIMAAKLHSMLNSIIDQYAFYSKQALCTCQTLPGCLVVLPFHSVVIFGLATGTDVTNVYYKSQITCHLCHLPVNRIAVQAAQCETTLLD